MVSLRMVSCQISSWKVFFTLQPSIVIGYPEDKGQDSSSVMGQGLGKDARLPASFSISIAAVWPNLYGYQHHQIYIRTLSEILKTLAPTSQFTTTYNHWYVFPPLLVAMFAFSVCLNVSKQVKAEPSSWIKISFLLLFLRATIIVISIFIRELLSFYFTQDKSTVTPTEGCMFMTYSTLTAMFRGKRRLDQLIQWLGGSSFSGVVIFDEAHKVGDKLSFWPFFLFAVALWWNRLQSNKNGLY